MATNKHQKKHDDLAKTVGERIAKLRQARDMSQQTLATKTGLCLSAVEKIEQGVRLPRLDTLDLMIEALETSWQSLMHGV